MNRGRRESREEGRRETGRNGEKGKERHGGRKKEKKLAVGSRDLVWYPTPPCACLGFQHHTSLPPHYEANEENAHRRGEKRDRGERERKRERADGWRRGDGKVTERRWPGEERGGGGGEQAFLHRLLPNLMSDNEQHVSVNNQKLISTSVGAQLPFRVIRLLTLDELRGQLG